MTLYERIKQMTIEEMQVFMYWVYLSGNKDGSEDLQDSPNGYFGGHFLTLDVNEVIPFNNLDLLYDQQQQKLLDKEDI